MVGLRVELRLKVIETLISALVTSNSNVFLPMIRERVSL